MGFSRVFVTSVSRIFQGFFLVFTGGLLKG